MRRENSILHLAIHDDAAKFIDGIARDWKRDFEVRPGVQDSKEAVWRGQGLE